MSFGGYNQHQYYQSGGSNQNNTPAQRNQATGIPPYYRPPNGTNESQSFGPAQPQYSPGPPPYSASTHLGYQGYNFSRDGVGQSGRVGMQSEYQDAQVRTFVDTSALGNLAYASSLGRNDSPVQRGADAEHETVKRETPSTYASPQLASRPDSYGSTNAIQYGHTHTYGTSTTPTTSVAPSTLAPYAMSPATTVSSLGQQSYQSSGYTQQLPGPQASNTYRVPDAQRSTTQTSHWSRQTEQQVGNKGQQNSDSHQLSQRNQTKQQMANPMISQGRQQSYSTSHPHSSAQNHPHTPSQVYSPHYPGSNQGSRPSSQLSNRPANQSIGLPQNYQSSQKANGASMNQPQSNSSAHTHYSPRQSMQVPQSSVHSSTIGLPQQVDRRPDHESRPSTSHQQNPSISYSSASINPALAKLINTAENAQRTAQGQIRSASPSSQLAGSTAVNNQDGEGRESNQAPTQEYPTTVDPSQVFNEAEYMRRKAGVRSAQQKESEQSRQKAMADAAKGNTIHVNSSMPTSKPESQNGDSEKEKREAELRELFGSMFGQMRELKAKDPVMFLEIWEEFKRGQPPPRASSQARQTREGQANVTVQKVQSPVVSDGQFPSPSLPAPSAIPATDGPSAPSDVQTSAPQPKRKSRSKEGLANGGIIADLKKQDATPDSRSNGTFNVEIMVASHAPTALQPNGPSITLPPGPNTNANEALVGSNNSHSPRPDTGQGSISISTPPNGKRVNAEAGTRGPRRTEWPETSKAPIAHAAVEFFKISPGNEGRPLDPQEIIGWLNRGPTYNEFCEIFESKGFTLDRSAFARAMLSAVPPADAPKNRAAPLRTSTMKPDTNGTLQNRPVLTQAPSVTSNEGTPGKRPRGRPRKDGSFPIHIMNMQGSQSSTHSGIRNSSVAISDRSSSLVPTTHHAVGLVDPNIDPRLTLPVPDGYSPAPQQQPSYYSPYSAPHGAPVAEMYRPSAGYSQRPVSYTPYKPGSQNPVQTLKWKETKYQGQLSVSVVEPTGYQQHPDPQSIPNENLDPMTSRLNDFKHSLNESNQPTTHSAGETLTAAQRKRSLPKPMTSHLSAPKSKEEMARKRSFNDIVDLSQFSDDEQPPSKQLKLQEDHADLLNRVSNTDTADEIMNDVAEESFIAARNSTPQDNTNEPMVKDTRIPATDPTKDRPRTDNVVRLIDKSKVRKDKYNISTIARDVLVASGRHPYERPLNYHLFGLRDTFKTVTDYSDLDTLRWDILDPGGPPPGSPKQTESNQVKERPADIPNLPTPIKRPRGRPKVKGLEKSQPTIDPPDYEGLNAFEIAAKERRENLASFANQRAAAADSGTDVAQPTRPIRRRVPITTADGVVEMEDDPAAGLRPGHLKAKSSSKLRTMNPTQVSPGAVGSVLHRVSGNIKSAAANGTPSNLGASSLGQVPYQSSTTNVSGAAVQSSPLASNQSINSGPPMSPSVIVQLSQHPYLSSHPSTPRRGRPPGSKNKSSASRDIIKSTETPDTQVKRRGRPPGSRNRSSIALGSLRATRTPSGLRRSAIPDDGLEVRVPSRDSSIAVPSPHNELAIPGPISKKSRDRGEQRPPTPPFVVFECQWKDCPAKLHNLEILRKHVFKVHGKPSADGKHACRWEDCGESQTQENEDTIMVDKAPEPIHRKFDSADSWKVHVEGSHIGPLAWTLGDGPTTYPDDTPNTDYLRDSSGRQITPIIMESPHSARSHSSSNSISNNSKPLASGTRGFTFHNRTTTATNPTTREVDWDLVSQAPTNSNAVKVLVVSPAKNQKSPARSLSIEMSAVEDGGNAEVEEASEEDVMHLLDGIPDDE